MGHSTHLSSSGHIMPSVSEIPGIYNSDMSGFEDWICRGLHDKESICCTQAKRAYYKEAGDLGNDIHELREAFLRGETFEEGVPEYQAAVFDPVAAFYRKTGYKPLAMPSVENTSNYALELKITGKAFGGTLDGAGTFQVPFWVDERKTFWDKRTLEFCKDRPLKPQENTIWIDDLKIKSKIDILHPLQLYGYSLLLKEVYGIAVEWGLIIRREKKLEKTPQIQLKGYYLPAYKEAWDCSTYMWHFING